MTEADALLCPGCGAAPPVPPGARTLTCPSCNEALLVQGPEVTPRLTCNPAIEPPAAERAAREWMHGSRMVEFLARRAKLEAPRLMLLPFARLEGDVLGWIFGEKKQVEDKKTTYVDMEIEVAESHDESAPVCDVAELGVQRLRSLSDKVLHPYDARQAESLGEVAPALISEDLVAQRAEASYRAAARKGSGLDRFYMDDLSVVGLRKSIVYWPFYRVGYRFAGRDYLVMIDAVDGAVAYGKAPGSDLFRAIFFALLLPASTLVLIVGIAAGMAIIAAGIAASDVSDKLAGVLITAGAAVGIALVIAGIYVATAAHHALRYGGEIEDGYGVHTGAGLFDFDEES
jgi:hypothetical protein